MRLEHTFHDLASNLKDMTIEQVEHLLENERRIGRRESVIVLLHGRYTRLRAALERQALLSELDGDAPSRHVSFKR